MDKPIGLVLMGGKSSRMGTDKAFVKWHDKTFLERSIKLIQSVCDEFYLSVNQEQFNELSTHYPCIKDSYPEKGPMGGILSAMEHTKANLLVVAIDMPTVEIEILNELLTKEGSTIIAFQEKTNRFWQPFPSYWPKNIITALKTSVSKTTLSLQHFLSNHNAMPIYIESNSFQNINSPEQLNDLKKLK